MKNRLSTAFACACVASFSLADDTAMSASQLAARLNALQQDGNSHVRLKMEIHAAARESLQLQIKQRRTSSGTDIVYQILWPKERAGESVLLRKSPGDAARGTLFVPPNTLRAIEPAQLKEPLFGSDLCYADVIDNFFAWDQQAIVGSEVVDRTTCQILESRPGRGERSPYAVVRSWIDTRRLVPLRIEKYSSAGKLMRRIETTRVVSDDGRHLPANLTVTSPQRASSTEIDGSRLRRGVAYTDRDFTPEGLKELTTPRAGAD